MPAVKDKIYLPYDEARPYILDADVLLYDGRSMVSKVIKAFGRTSYSHAGLAGWTNGDPESEYSRLFVYEMVMHGGSGTMLSAQAEKWSGMIDVYRTSDAHTEFDWDPTRHQQVGETKVLDRRLAVSLMRDFCRPGEYGFRHLLMATVYHLPIVRFFVKKPNDDQLEERNDSQLEERTHPPICSEAVAYVLRKAFTDVVRNTPDQYTEPGDLAMSPLLHYMFTLMAPTKED